MRDPLNKNGRPFPERPLTGIGLVRRTREGKPLSHRGNRRTLFALAAAVLGSRQTTATAQDSRFGAEGPATTLLSVGVLAALGVLVLVLVGTGDESPNSP